MNWYKKAQKEREYPVAAVVIADNIKFEGRTHGEAIQKAIKAGHIHKDEDGYLIDTDGNTLAFTGAIDLFKTNLGRIIDRFEAFNLGEATGAENIPEHELNVEKDTTTPSLSTSTSPSSSESMPITPRQIYTRDDVIQNREDLAPSMLRRKRRI